MKMGKYVVIHVDGEGTEFIGTKEECISYIVNELRKDVDYVDCREEYEEEILALQSGKTTEILWYVILTPEEALECGR